VPIGAAGIGGGPFLIGDIVVQTTSQQMLPQYTKFFELRKFFPGKSVFASRGRVKSLVEKGEVRIARSILPRQFSTPGPAFNGVTNGCFQRFIHAPLKERIRKTSPQSSIEDFRKTAVGAGKEFAHTDRVFEFLFVTQHLVRSALATFLSKRRSMPFRSAEKPYGNHELFRADLSLIAFVHPSHKPPRSSQRTPTSRFSDE
jgi:hypothetical protein